MRRLSLLPLVASRTKNPDSLPATSHVYGVKPDDPFFSRRNVGVLPSTACIVTTGVAVPKPTRPLEAT